MRTDAKLLCLLIVTVVALGSLSSSSYSIGFAHTYGGQQPTHKAMATRAPSLVVDDGSTVTLTSSDVNYYANITVTNGSKLVIQDTTITVEQFVLVNESSSFSMDGAEIRIQGDDIGGKYFLGQDVDSFEMVDSTIKIQGKSNPGPFGTPTGDGEYGGDGESAMFKLELSGKTLTLSDSSIEAYGGGGGTGQEGANNPSGSGYNGADGGNGGDAIIIINSSAAEIEVESCTFVSQGGDGGEGGEYGAGSPNGLAGDGGSGGKGIVMLNTEKGGVNILNSHVECLGGDGGKGGKGYDYGGDGGDWGTGEFYASTTSVGSMGAGIYIEDTHINATRGNYGLGGLADNGDRGEGGNHDGTDIDDSLVDFRMNSLDFLDSSIMSSYYYFTSSATIQANLDNVTVAPQGQAHWAIMGDVTLNFLQTLTVVVKGEDGTPLEGASVRIVNKDESTISKSGTTGSDGTVELKAPGRIVTSMSDKLQYYNIDVTYRGVQQLMSVSLNDTREVEFIYPLIQVSIDEDSITPQPVDGKVGETVTIYGTTHTDYSEPIVWVKVSIMPAGSTGDPVWMEAEQVGSDWSQWRFVWDTNDSQDDTEYVIKAMASDLTLTAEDSITLTVDKDVINHPPEIEFTTPQDSSFNVGGIGSEKWITVEGTVKDRDANGDNTPGRVVESVFLAFYKEDGTPVGDGSWVTINELADYTLNWSSADGEGAWKASFDAVSRLQESDQTYIIKARCFDGKLYSSVAELRIYMHILAVPSLKVTDQTSGMALSSSSKIEVTDDGNKKNDVVISISTEGSKSGFPVGSEHENNMLFRYSITTGSGDVITSTDWVTTKTFQAAFDSEPTDPYKDEDIYYYLTVEMKNDDGQTKKTTVEIVIHYKAKELPDKGILVDVPESQRSLISTSMILVVVLMNLLGALLIFMKVKKIESRRVMQKERAKAAAEKKKKEKKPQESIYAMEAATREPTIYEHAPTHRESAYEITPTYTDTGGGPAYDLSETHTAPAYARPTSPAPVYSQPSAGGNCPRCGAPVQPNWIICPKCHAKLR